MEADGNTDVNGASHQGGRRSGVGETRGGGKVKPPISLGKRRKSLQDEKKNTSTRIEDDDESDDEICPPFTAATSTAHNGIAIAVGSAGPLTKATSPLHELIQQPEGSRDDGASARRKCLQCRHCPAAVGGKANVKRRTTWQCTICKIGLHPECFVAYHVIYPAGAENTRRVRRRRDEDGNLVI